LLVYKRLLFIKDLLFINNKFNDCINDFFTNILLKIFTNIYKYFIKNIYKYFIKNIYKFFKKFLSILCFKLKLINTIIINIKNIHFLSSYMDFSLFLLIISYFSLKFLIS